MCFNVHGVTKDHKQRRTPYHLKSQFLTSKKNYGHVGSPSTKMRGKKTIFLWKLPGLLGILIVGNDFY